MRAIALLVWLVACASCRPEADVGSADDIRDLPSAAEPLGGQARDPAAEDIPSSPEPAEPDPVEPGTPLRPAPGGSEE